MYIDHTQHTHVMFVRGVVVDRLHCLLSLPSLSSGRSYLGSTGSSCEPAESPPPHLRPPPASLLQSQRDGSVAHHRSNAIHPDPGAPAAPPHDCPLPADDTVGPAAALHGAEHAQPAPVPFSPAYSRSVRPLCPNQPGGPSEPSQPDGKRPLDPSPRPHPAPHPAPDQRTGSIASGQSGRPQRAANAADSGDGEVRVQ